MPTPTDCSDSSTDTCGASHEAVHPCHARHLWLHLHCAPLVQNTRSPLGAFVLLPRADPGPSHLHLRVSWPAPSHAKIHPLAARQSAALLLLEGHSFQLKLSGKRLMFSSLNSTTSNSGTNSRAGACLEIVLRRHANLTLNDILCKNIHDLTILDAGCFCASGASLC